MIHTENNKVFTEQEIRSHLEDTWSKHIKDIRVFYGATGRGGAIQYQEMILGRELTTEEKEEFKEGFYEFSNGFLTYKG